MSYYHVEDSSPPRAAPIPIAVGHKGGGLLQRDSSGELTAHSVWRCYYCRGWCVTQLGSQPPKRCGKCGR